MRVWLAAALVMGCLAPLAGACRPGGGDPRSMPAARPTGLETQPGQQQPGSPGTPPSSTTTPPGANPAADPSEIEEVRKARAALASAGIAVYPGSQGLDSTEFEANTTPFIAIDFFSLDPPSRVVAFYDRELKELTTRRNATLEPGVVRYEFERAFSGLAVKPWDPKGADSLASVQRFDRRDAQGVTTDELDAYGIFLGKARTHVVVNLPRPESGKDAS